eukprot:TRINITY_DN10191_c0_g1_i2.p1 TRINITY_DN10191_c0_g1~~TRINITY_DN10191_c0_g1_i2.p1  ORF type:complete len:660 (-),score=121.17 TRINITY_DN10191_c0_g1_i2:247-2226(-)
MVCISTNLKTLPASMGRLTDLTYIFANNNFLETIPAAVAALPSLTQLCLDCNRITHVPPVLSKRLELFTGAGNKLVEFPSLSGNVDRIEIYGNQLTCCKPRVPHQIEWTKMLVLKVMGNKLRDLPAELGLMTSMRNMVISCNELTELPDVFGSLLKLEWFVAYGNRLEVLPENMLTASKILELCLLESNPLKASTIAKALNDVYQGSVKCLGLDEEQMARFTAVATDEEKKWIPRALVTGSICGSIPNYYAKLMRASQLRKKGREARSLLNPPTTPPAPMLVVAFTASQAEPEWLGLLRRLLENPWLAPLPEHEAPLDAGVTDFDQLMGMFWNQLARTSTANGGWAEKDDGKPAGEHELKADFDVLSLVDHGMGWYMQDYENLQRALTGVCSSYEKVIFLGASMGGFGALVHCGNIADGVMAFGPQSRLHESILRPTAADTAELEGITRRCNESIQQARSRGAIVEIQTAADGHLIHSIDLPLADLAVTVHPLCPRKPFARILDRGGVLMPILRDLVLRVMQKPKLTSVPDVPSHGPPKTVSIAKWGVFGHMGRVPADLALMMNLFFAPGRPNMPRMGDWFCPTCKWRNIGSFFWCQYCKKWDVHLASPGVRRVSDGCEFPRAGDWGCGRCSQANAGCQKWCQNCKAGLDEAFPHHIVV